MALGLADARDLVKRGLLTKDGGPAAMDHYFDQIDRTAKEYVEDDYALAEESEEHDSSK